MFTPNGTLGEVISALSGFDYAAQLDASKNKPKRETSASHVLNWLTDEFPAQGATPLSRWVPGMLERYKTEEAALSAMAEFASTIPKGID